MAKRRASTGKKPRRASARPSARPKRSSFLKGLSHFLRSPVVWRVLLAVIVAAVLFWQWPAITSWVAGVRDSILNTFGWGLIFIGVIIAAVLCLIFWRQLSDWARRWHLQHWHKWLGAIVFMLAIWGVLAFFHLGGNIGLAIIGQNATDYPVILSVLRVIGLVVIGIMLVIPGPFFRFVGRSIVWLARRLRRQPSPETPPKAKPAPAAAKPQPSVPEKEPSATPALVEADSELQQVAQQVWKKYGESADLVAVNGWRLPPIDILDKATEVEMGEADNLERARLIEEALASYGVEAKVVQINAGPTVTQFGVEPGWDKKVKEVREKSKDGSVKLKLKELSRTRVKVERITSLSNDLALALAAPSIRIEAPVPGKSMVGVEVPNTISGMVSLRGVIETTVFQKMMPKAKLPIALGKGAGGESVAADLSKMPHLLIAGATGSGKTVCLNAIICCLLMHGTPYDVKFIMIDPKRVELTPFNSIPHLAAPVIVETNKALGTLRWLNLEMDRRYQRLASAGTRNIEGYNKNKHEEEKLPYLVLVIDELADLMMAGFDEVEHIICRLAQLARAVGIHLVVATQRPSVDVVTGLIKANFPTRISFAVTSQVDSRTILDTVGAEKLLGKGDMLYMPTEAAKPKRLQGCYVSDPETERLVYFWGSQRREDTGSQLKVEEIVSPVIPGRREASSADPLLDTARQLAQEHEHISTSFLQRRLHIGYPRAARLMEQLEAEETGKEEDKPTS
ncbi:MAG: DNA translocase FtsK [Dehalococcoidales bacterium]|nr:DNA translocase FtsK [Dehalococcoidales bacterium]